MSALRPPQIYLGTAALLLALAGVPSPAQAQTTSEQQFLVSAWTRFISYCAPFVQDPVAFRASLEQNEPADLQGHSEDRAFFDFVKRSETDGSGVVVVLEQFSSEINGACTGETFFEPGQHNPDLLAHNLRLLLENTPPIVVRGSKVNYGANRSAEAEAYYHFLIDGVFTESDAQLLSYISEEGVVFDVFVQAALDGGAK